MLAFPMSLIFYKIIENEWHNMTSFGYHKLSTVIKYLNYFKLLNVLFLNILVALNFSSHCNPHTCRQIFSSIPIYILRINV